MKYERVLELLNKLIDQMIEDEGMNIRRVIANLLELGFEKDELVELNFAIDDVYDFEDESED